VRARAVAAAKKPGMGAGMGALAGGAGGLGAGLLMGAPAAWHLLGAAWVDAG
jgi:hypothetical protein